LDFSIFKDFPITERMKLQFRTEVFNLFNQSNFGTPSASIAYTHDASGNITGIDFTGSHATTGQINSMNGNWNQREFQFGLKLLF
jgi:hypothetical protein